jgi:hypothetical protein
MHPHGKFGGAHLCLCLPSSQSALQAPLVTQLLQGSVLAVPSALGSPTFRPSVTVPGGKCLPRCHIQIRLCPQLLLHFLPWPSSSGLSLRSCTCSRCPPTPLQSKCWKMSAGLAAHSRCSVLWSGDWEWGWIQGNEREKGTASTQAADLDTLLSWTPFCQGPRKRNTDSGLSGHTVSPFCPSLPRWHQIPDSLSSGREK